MTSQSTIPSVQLGASGPTVGVQGLGAMAMATGYYGDTDEAESLATLHHALDRGVTLFDTADMYGEGRNEAFLSPFVRVNRDRLTIATKFGFSPNGDGSYAIDNRPAYIAAAVEASLQRLGLETIDLYYMHRRNRDTPLADSVGAMADLVRAGKVRFLGLSEVTGEELRAAHAIHPITAVQSEWSLFSRDVEPSVVPVAAELGIGFVPYAPLGRGMLTGAASGATLDKSDVRNAFPRFSDEHAAGNARLVERIGDVARARGATAAQVALAWVHSRGAAHGLTVVPIPGTRRPGRLDENLGALDVQLNAGELAALDGLSSQVQGIRLV